MKKPFRFRPKNVDLLKRAALQPGEEPGGEALVKALLNHVADLERRIKTLENAFAVLGKIIPAQTSNIEIVSRAVVQHEALLAPMRKASE